MLSKLAAWFRKVFISPKPYYGPTDRKDRMVDVTIERGGSLVKFYGQLRDLESLMTLLARSKYSNDWKFFAKEGETDGE